MDQTITLSGYELLALIIFSSFAYGILSIFANISMYLMEKFWLKIKLERKKLKEIER